MKRLDFLKKGASVTSSTVLGLVGIKALSSLTGCSEIGPKVIGLQLYSLREAMNTDVPATLKKVAEMGYKRLETAGYKDGKIYGYTPAEFKKICEDLGMKVTSAHVGQLYDPLRESEIMEWWNVALEAQAAVGCKYTILPWLPACESIEIVKQYADYFNKVGALAATKGIQFGFHNHAGEFATCDGEVVLDYFIANTDPKNVVYQLDVFWAKKGGVDPSEYIRKHKGRMPLLHIKDESIIGESGELDFESIFNTAYECGLKDYYVEVEKYTMPPENCVQRSFDYLDTATFTK